MADTTEVANQVRGAARRTAARAEESLEEQMAALQSEIKAISGTIAKLADERVSDVKANARSQYRSLVNSGKSVADDLGDQMAAYEGQLADAIRERPLTAVAGAIGVGFLIALLSRR